MAASFLGMAFAKLDTLTMVKAGALELRTREARKAAEEAHASAQQLREVACALARANLQMVAREGLSGGMPFREKLSLRKDLRESLLKLGVEEHHLAHIESVFDRMVLFKLAQRVEDALITHTAVSAPGTGQIRKFFDASLSVKGLTDFAELSVPTAQSIRGMLAAHGLNSERVEHALKDLEYYERTRRFRKGVIGSIDSKKRQEETESNG